MQCVLFALLIFVTLVMLAGFGWGGTRGATRGLKACDQLAAHYRGVVHRVGWFGHPRVSFQHRSAGVLVGVFSHTNAPGRNGPLTQLQIAWPDPRFSCSISHPPRPPGLTVQDGLRSWQSGLPEFDARYSVRTSDRTLMSSMLNGVVQRQIEQLRRLPRSGPLMVELHRGTLCISKWRALHRPQELLEFVRVGLELYDQTLLSATEGIQFLDEPVAQPLQHVICQICGEEITSDLVFCRRCKTPHHRDCWLYAGRCSVFGCGETQFQVPRKALFTKQIPND